MWSACVPPGLRETNAKWTSVSDATEHPASLTRTREMWFASKYLLTLFVLQPWRASSPGSVSKPDVASANAGISNCAYVTHNQMAFSPGKFCLPACNEHPLFLHPSAAQMAELHQAVSCVMDIATMEEPVTWTPTPTYPSVSKSLLNG